MERSEGLTKGLMEERDNLKHGLNNNSSSIDLRKKFSNESVPELKHTKFCFSKDISEKEESLRSCRASVSSHNQFESRSNYKDKKAVSFNNNFPVYLDISKGRKKIPFLETPSDSEIDLLGKSFVDASSETDMLSLSESEIFDIENMPHHKTEIIAKAQTKLTHILNKLQSILLDVQESESVPNIQPSMLGEHNLLELISRIGFVTDQLDSHCHINFKSSTDIDKLARLQSSNEFLKEQLESQKIMKNCLESEIKYLTKEKALLNEEVKQLTFKMAITAGNTTKSPSTSPTNVTLEKSPKTEVFYRNPNQQFEQTNSNSSAISASDDLTSSNKLSQGLETVKTKTTPDANDVKSSSPTAICFVNGNTEQLENEFDSIMDCVKERGNVMDNLQFQLKNYDEEIHSLQDMITSTHEEKKKILRDLEMLVDGQKTLLRERDHYESILKLILKEKTSDEFNLQELLQNLISKLNIMSSNPNAAGNSTHASLLEGALQAVQEQNSSQREEISRLKQSLSTEKHINSTKVSTLEMANRQVSQQLEILARELKAKDEEIKSANEEVEQKYETLQELHQAVSDAKYALEKSISDKEEEVKNLKEGLESLKKTNLKQHKKLQDLHKTNVKLIKEIEELKRNMEQLAAIISQLRSSLKEQKGHWSERLRLSSEEASQSKEQCRWLQTQIEHMNQQLDEAHERIKAHESDKAQLAQQVLLAEEERKVVDRKLQELRAALQGDTALREALIQRNEALQIEINRLRRSKLVSLTGGNERTLLEENPPPMEMNNNDDPLSSVKVMPPTDHNYSGEKQKKNRYTSATRRGNDVPRTAVSLHNGGLTQGSTD